jgi:hypothetical protein
VRELKDQFTEVMFDIYHRAKAAAEYDATIFFGCLLTTAVLLGKNLDLTPPSRPTAMPPRTNADGWT